MRDKQLTLYAEEVVLDSPVLTEGGEVKGTEWDVTIVRPGVSIKGTEWPPEVLAEAAPLYEGIPVGINVKGDHEEDSGFKRLVIGFIDTIRTEAGEIKGRLHLDQAPEALRQVLVKAYLEGKPFGLSHVVRARHTEAQSGNRIVRLVQKILKPEFVDLVLRPSAGGRLETLVAGLASDKNAKEIFAMPSDDEGKTATETGLSEAAVKVMIDSATKPLTEALAASTSELNKERSARILTEAIAESGLPDKAKEIVRTRFADRETFTESEVAAEIDSFRGLLDIFKPKAQGQEGNRVTAGEYDRYSDAMTESLFHTKTKRDSSGKITGYELMPQKLGRDASPKRWYVDLTGDDAMTGKVQNSGRLTESIASSTFANIMGDSVTRAMLANYAQLNLDSWRPIVRINRVTDFRTQRRERLGGYANFPTVNQGAAYTAMTSPTDQEATYTPTKRGGTEDLTMESIANDDIGALREIPRRFARAAAQTLHEFVWDFIKTNPTCTYDSVALFHASHSNTDANTLSLPNLVTGRNKMLKQADMSNSKRLAIRPRYLIVPIDLEELSYQLTTSDRVVGNNYNDPNFAKKFGLTPIVVEYWTDADDWYLACDPADAPTIEIGFFNGQEDPEMFVQDQPTVGNVFTNDKITYKLRHIYGGSLLDHRGFYGGVQD